LNYIGYKQLLCAVYHSNLITQNGWFQSKAHIKKEKTNAVKKITNKVIFAALIFRFFEFDFSFGKKYLVVKKIKIMTK